MSAATKVKDSVKKSKSKVKGTGRDAKGRFKAGAGAAIGDTHMQAEGMTDQGVADVKKTAVKAKAGTAKAAAKTQDTAKRVAVSTKKKAKTAAAK
jgi:uncharacterized protein YjbJ (UPF0337 family)